RVTGSSMPHVVKPIRSIMLDSREAYVSYTMPLGLHHLIGGDHYAPMPENTDPRRSDWSATTYHRADAGGIGYDRTPAGSNGVGQYRSPLREQWADPATTPTSLLPRFHPLSWDWKLPSGRTLWNALVAEYTRGAEVAGSFPERWRALQGWVDPERHAAVAAKLQRQAADAAAWRDKCLRYFEGFSRRPLALPSPSPAPASESPAP